MTAPRKSILDRSFRYTSAANTNLKASFKRIRKAQALQKKREQEPKQSVDTGVIIGIMNSRRTGNTP